MGIDANAILCFGTDEFKFSKEFNEQIEEEYDGYADEFIYSEEMENFELGFRNLDPMGDGEWQAIYLKETHRQASGKYGESRLIELVERKKEDLKEEFIKLCEKNQIKIDPEKVGWLLITHFS